MDFDKYEPMDVSKLSKGDFISSSDCQIMTGEDVNSKNYQLHLLGLRDRIQKAADDIDHIIALRIEGDGIKVMTDEEASEYFERMLVQMRKRARRYLRSMGHRVDTSQLSDGRFSDHMRTIALETQRQLGGKRAARRYLKAEQAKQISVE